MAISIDRWKELRDLADKAATAYADLETAVMLESYDQYKAGDVEAHRNMVNIHNRFLPDLELRFLAYMLTPQTEWTGGDSMNPANFRTREPHAAKDFR